MTLKGASKGLVFSLFLLGTVAASPVGGAGFGKDGHVTTNDFADFETAAGEPIDATFDDVPLRTPGLSSNLVRDIQDSLSEQGFYFGPIDGRMGPKTEAAIRAYQDSADLPVDGQPSNRLAKDLNTAGQVSRLLGRLEISRKRTIEAARDALLAHPETRSLVSGTKMFDRNAPHDSEACMKEPEPRCLLLEAFASARDIDKPEMRDWALGEILTAQARAGLAEDAMATTRRIHDPRLIMVALRDIAKARATVGAIDDAIAAMDIIPDPVQQIEAYLYIVETQAKDYETFDAQTAVKGIAPYLERVDDQLLQITFLTRLSSIVFKSGHEDVALSQLKASEDLLQKITDDDTQDKAKRHIAASYAETGDAERALTMLKTVENGGDDIPVLIAAATGQAQAGEAKTALITAESIEAVRYRALVLARIATYQGGAGQYEDAQETLDKAKTAAAEIKFPFAKAYAFSRIALAFNDVGISMGDSQNLLEHAVETAHLISDDRLRAHIFWTIADERRRGGDITGASKAQDAASLATDDILSPFSRVWMLCDIAEDRANRLENDAAWSVFHVALEEAKTIRNPWGRARALGKVAATMTALADQTALAAQRQTETPKSN